MYSKRLLKTARYSLERRNVIHEIKHDMINKQHLESGVYPRYDTDKLNKIIDDLMTCGNDEFQAEIVLQELEDLIKGVA